MNYKKILLIIAIIFLVGTAIRFYIYMQAKSMAEEFTNLANTAEEKADEANMKYITFYLRDLIKDWNEQNGSYANFSENSSNIEKINIFTAKYNYTKANVEHEIFTTTNSYVIKVKPIAEKVIYCVDNKVALEEPWIRVISFNGDNFDRVIDCNNVPLK